MGGLNPPARKKNVFMNLEQLREYCLSKKAVEEGTPFGPETLVYKVMGKIFAITSFAIPCTVNLKCDPEYAAELREQYEDVQPGYHMNKKHWNTVRVDGKLNKKMAEKLIDHSYDLILKSLPKKLQDEYKNL